jgi:hypothetical protein
MDSLRRAAGHHVKNAEGDESECRLRGVPTVAFSIILLLRENYAHASFRNFQQTERHLQKASRYGTMTGRNYRRCRHAKISTTAADVLL